jgi:hypothetical protein
MDVKTLTVNAKGAGGTLYFDMTDTDFTVVPGNNGAARLSSSTAGIVYNGSVSFQSWANFGTGGNQEFGGLDPVSGAVVTTDSQGYNRNVFNSVKELDFTLQDGGPFSMTSRTVVKLGAHGSFSGTDGRTSVITADPTGMVVTPVPTGMVLALTGIPLIGVGLWRMRRKHKG